MSDQDEKHVKDKFSCYKKTANTVQKLIKNSDEAKDWWVKNKSEIFRQDLEYPVLEASPMIEQVSGRYEVIDQDANLNSMKYFKSMYEGLIHDLFWWNIQGKESAIKIKLHPVVLKLIYIRYLEDGVRTCKKVAEISGYEIGTIYNFFSILRQVIKEERLKIDK